MDETQTLSNGDFFIACIVTYAVLVATCLYLVYKNKAVSPSMDMDMSEDEPSAPQPSRPAKRKTHPRPTEVSENCVREIREFLRAGVPGMKELAKVYPALRVRYHPADPDGWADSCNAAFSGYGRDIQRRLEECEWELDRLDPCELWFLY